MATPGLTREECLAFVVNRISQHPSSLLLFDGSYSSGEKVSEFLQELPDIDGHYYYHFDVNRELECDFFKELGNAIADVQLNLNQIPTTLEIHTLSTFVYTPENLAKAEALIQYVDVAIKITNDTIELLKFRGEKDFSKTQGV